MQIGKIIFIFILYMSCNLYADNKIQIKEVVTKKGFKFLFVENHDLPKVSIAVTFKGAGSAYEHTEKQGLSFLTSLVVKEGSGENSAKEFAQKLNDKGIQLFFNPTLEDFTISVDTLSENLEESVALMSDAIMRPKVDPEGLSRAREFVKVSINYCREIPGLIGMQEITKLIYKRHPYARNVYGTLSTVTSLTREDILGYIKRNFTKNNIVISVVGAVKSGEIEALLDKYLFKLPLQKSQSTKSLPVKNDFGHAENKHIDMNIPYSVIFFAQKGIAYNDPNYHNALVLMNAVGGQSLNSLLMRRLRETLAMTYGVYFYMANCEHGNSIYGFIQTDSSNTIKAISAIKGTLSEVKRSGIDMQLFKDAKIDIVNSYVFSMFSNARIASRLSFIQMNGLDTHYFNSYIDYVNQVKLDEVNALAKFLLDPENLFIVEVGKPVKSSGSLIM
ncbi:peptidase M16 [Wolbachia pipientis]|uniref:Peptidase M16 n=1 Tax=Wolbachia pipientis TaxID=955 RepID=A0A1E7QKV3_WOLPI|nr:pitrilysin family protein [Wolbachia pipientis]OEY87110.1 peptidase M16 [Wolbachia pipientis]